MRIRNMHMFLLLFVTVFSSAGFCQSQENLSSSFREFIIDSKELGEQVQISLRLPSDYDASISDYPVLYILDGQWFFSHGVSVQVDLSERNGPKLAPAFIVVGITTDNEKRWEWTMENTDDFVKFIENELFTFMDKTYRCSQERLIFGWETTGKFVVNLLQSKPDLFSCFLAASPAPLYGEYFQNLETEHINFKHYFQSIDHLDKALFIGEGQYDYPAQYGINQLSSLLNENVLQGFRWKHQVFEGISHEYSGGHTLSKGVQFYYEGYGPLKFTSLKEFDQMGGLPYLETYYKKKKLAQTSESNEASMHITRRNLSLLAMAENDFKAFSLLLQNFEKYNFLEKSFTPHINSYAHFYLSHDDHENALKLADLMYGRDAEDASCLNAYGDIYLKLNKKNKAKAYYSKAVEFGKKNQDWRLFEYEKDLKILQVKTNN